MRIIYSFVIMLYTLFQLLIEYRGNLADIHMALKHINKDLDKELTQLDIKIRWNEAMSKRDELGK